VADVAPPTTRQALEAFDHHAVSIAKRQYFQPGDGDLLGMFRRVANWVASPEDVALRSLYAETFFDLMLSKRFCPGGRVLAGAATSHGNVLNCFVQDGRPEVEGSDAWVLHLATKLAVVTKVGGGNGLCLDPIAPKRPFTGTVGRLYLTIVPSHPDYDKVRDGTFMDLVHGTYVTRGYRAATFAEYHQVPTHLAVKQVGDSVESIWSHASDVVTTLLSGQDLLLDLSELRPEGTPVNGSGGTSSGPSSFAVEVFDSFARWATLGGAEYAGPVATLRYVFAPTLRVIRQGGTRRGAGMATISITHPDVPDFITAKDLAREQAEGDISTFNISVLVSDAFMREAAATGRSTVLREIAEHAWETGEPGLIYIDRINEHNPLRATLGDIKATNPCFTADTRIATHRGLVTLGELYASQEPLFVASDRRVRGDAGGIAFRAAVPVFMTSPAEPVYRVVTKHGYEVRATANHKFLTPSGWTELRDLVPGSELLIQSGEGVWSDQHDFSDVLAAEQRELVATAGSNGRGPRTGRSDVRRAFAGLPTTWNRELGTLLGFVTGDGFVSDGGAGISFAAADVDELAPYVDQYRTWLGGGTQVHQGSVQVRFGRVAVGYLKSLGVTTAKATEKRVPASIFTAPRSAVVGYLQGLFTADGTVNLSAAKRSCSVRLASSSRALLQDVQLLLSNFGIVSRLHARRPAATRALPDGRGGSKAYACAAQYELILDKVGRDAFLHKIGFLTRAKGEKASAFVASKRRVSNAETYRTVVSAVIPDGVEPVFDTTEPIAHSVVANGLVAHQCGEIPLFPGEPCDLGAINLAQYVTRQGVGIEGFDTDGFRRDVGTCIRFLDNVLDVNRFALEDNREMSHYLRRLGLGIMGLADALILMGYRYDSEDGRAAVAAIIDELRGSALAASKALAEERGAFPGIGQSALAEPRRNVALLTVAPTGTTSMLMGVSSGVEPIFAPFIYRKIGSSYAAIIAPLFRELLERHAPHPAYAQGGAWDWDKVVERVQANHGSVQGLDFVPDDVKAVLVCAHDIAPTDHVRMQGVVQSAFDAGGDMVANSISKTINLPNGATVDDVYDAYALAFETGCKGITVYRDGSRDFQVLSTKVEKKDDTKAAAAPATNGAVAKPSHKGAEAAVPTASPSGASAKRTATFERLPSEPLFDRPTRLEGFTDAIKLTLPTGEKRGFYVTVNKQDGLPVECFVTSGKAGDEANADSEALGRVVSVALQYGVPAEAIVKTLRGINGGMYGTYGGRMVASRADLIAVALETAGVENVLQRGKGCPDCGTPLRFEEGCMKCESCGYSKCG
jgi:ribonucleoside-diphosphate reductase alpha chain